MLYLSLVAILATTFSMYSHIDIGVFADTFRGNDLSLLGEFLSTGGDVDRRDANGMTLLDYAAMYGNASAVSMLIQSGAKTQPREGDRTPMHYAVLFDKPNAVRALFQGGAGLSPHDNDGRTPLHVAIHEKKLELAQLLLQLGADVNAKAEFDETVLHYAVQTGEVRFVELVLSYNPDVNVEDVTGNTPLNTALNHQFIPMMTALTTQNAAVGSGNNRFDYGYAPLMQAVFSKKLEAVQAGLAGAGVNLESEDHRRQTALLHALFYGYGSIAKALIVAGADVNHADKYGQTPLMLAVLMGDAQLVKLIIDKGARINVFNENGTTALHLAAERGNVGLLKLLLEHGANAQARDRYRRLPLHLAVQSGALQAMRLLVDAGASDDVDAVSVYGTARELLEASQHGQVKGLVQFARQQEPEQSHGPTVRGLSAVQLVAALVTLTGGAKGVL